MSFARDVDFGVLENDDQFVGEDFLADNEWTDQDGDPFDFTGHVGTFEIWDKIGGTLQVTGTVTFPVLGTMTLAFSKTDSETLGVNDFCYSVKTVAAGFTEFWMGGTLRLAPPCMTP